MISHGPKHGFRSQNQVSRRLRTKFTISLLEVVLGLLQPLHPVLDLQVGLRLFKKINKIFSGLQNGTLPCFNPKNKGTFFSSIFLEI